MFNIENEENPIFSFIEILFKKNHNEYSSNFTRTNSITRIFNGVSPDFLLRLLKNIGENIMEPISKVESGSYTNDIQNLFCFVSKDIITVKYDSLPEIFLSRYFFEFDGSYVVLCNCCYKDLYKIKLNTFDLVFYIQNQDFWYSNKNENCSKVTLISRSSEDVVASKWVNTANSVFTNYGVFYIIYSLFIQLTNVITATKKYLKLKVSKLEIEKLFIEHFFSSIDAQVCKDII